MPKKRDPAVRQRRMPRNRRPAGAVKRAQKRPFAQKRGMGLRMIDGRQKLCDPRVAEPRLDADGALAGRGREAIGIQQFRHNLGLAQALQPGIGE